MKKEMKSGMDFEIEEKLIDCSSDHLHQNVRLDENNVTLNFDSKNGSLNLSALNDTKMCLFKLSLNRGMVQFITTTEKRVRIGVDLNVLLKGTKNLKPNHEMVIEVDQKKKKLTLNITKKHSTFSYTVNEFYSLEEDEFDIPKDVKYGCEALMPTEDFLGIINDVGSISDSIVIGVEADASKVFENENTVYRLYFHAHDSISEGRDNSDDTAVAFRMKDVLKFEYGFSSKYLKMLAKSCKLTKELLLRVPLEEFPLQITFRINTKGGGGGFFDFFLAPFVANDEMDEVHDNEVVDPLSDEGESEAPESEDDNRDDNEMDLD